MLHSAVYNSKGHLTENYVKNQNLIYLPAGQESQLSNAIVLGVMFQIFRNQSRHIGRRASDDIFVGYWENPHAYVVCNSDNEKKFYLLQCDFCQKR